MNFNFSLKVTAISILLAAGMIRASLWQWDRHLQKEDLIRELEETLLRDPIELSTLLAEKAEIGSLVFRRVKLSGEYDFSHEFLLRNRNLEGRAGFHIITPLKIDSSDSYVLIDRGFVPLGREGKEHRKQYQRPSHVALYGLLKEPVSPKFMSPNDPPAGLDRPWVDQWLRIDIGAIEKQMPYPLLRFYLEVMSDPNDPKLPSKIVREGAGGRSDVLVYTGQKQVENFGLETSEGNYPIPTYDTTPPPDIHLGYVYEWAFMAVLTILIGLVMQFKRAGRTNPLEVSPKTPS